MTGLKFLGTAQAGKGATGKASGEGSIETNGTDIRAIVVGGKVVASMQRKAVEGERRANIHAGGKGSPIELDFKTKSPDSIPAL